MNQRNFPTHGELNLSVDGQLLIIDGAGPANLEMVLKYQRSVIGYREQIMHAPWASLVLLHGMPLVPPEAKIILSETIKKAKTMHLQATAVVLVEVEFADVVKGFWNEIYQDAGVRYRFFDTEQQARHWLADILSHPDPNC
ncbi:MAG: hypothetical protein Alis3KO_26520 [Aliiglaciecola sp.]|uniref:hypothetical protein n=1 Tax=Aliiglaciecola sp. M165 TaxID=2593649 RepID=UPI00117FF43B|nr:hypothetical protein [Aliiglaciecola sp. M165]TRY30711.1 hypothetical protein FM019_12535 [Aliiglaciecola sp. M165]